MYNVVVTTDVSIIRDPVDRETHASVLFLATEREGFAQSYFEQHIIIWSMRMKNAFS
jgi:hypothetical protein